MSLPIAEGFNLAVGSADEIVPGTLVPARRAGLTGTLDASLQAASRGAMT